uniref:Clp R domain-containing protein n=1 Tax=Panagrolaimus davidi TaxID=227884 RepID=A0A914PH79_9BILA
MSKTYKLVELYQKIETQYNRISTINHAFLFLQIHCALYEQHSQVQIDGWKVDNEYKTCTNINSDNPTENIVRAAAFSSPPEHSRTLCEILEVAKKCANQYNKNGIRTEKLHIVAGLLLHDEIGKCKIEEMFPSVNFHLTIFWVHGHRKPPSVYSEIIDYAILESLTDISPKEGWIMPEVSLEQLQEAQEVGNGNPILDSLYLRLKRMSDNAKGITTTRKSRRTQRMQETSTASMSNIPSTTITSPMMTKKNLLPKIKVLNAERSNVASFLYDCQTALESGKIKKRFADDIEMFFSMFNFIFIASFAW